MIDIVIYKQTLMEDYSLYDHPWEMIQSLLQICVLFFCHIIEGVGMLLMSLPSTQKFNLLPVPIIQGI